MKKILYFLIISLASLNLKAQDSIPKMELRHNGFVGIGIDSTKTFVVLEFPKKSKNDLYKNCLTYLNGIYRNPDRVLSVVENESITINGLTESIKSELYWYKYPMYYNIKILFKENKLRFESTITDLTEIWSENKERKVYVANTDSPNSVEVNCIWMSNKNENGYFLFKEDLKKSIDNWINGYIKSLVNGIKENDW
jgi:hypothetical protein